MVASCSVRKALDSYAELQFTDESGKESTEIANKYYVMYGDMAKCSMSIDELRQGEITLIASPLSLLLPSLPPSISAIFLSNLSQCAFYASEGF